MTMLIRYGHNTPPLIPPMLLKIRLNFVQFAMIQNFFTRIPCGQFYGIVLRTPSRNIIRNANSHLDNVLRKMYRNSSIRAPGVGIFHRFALVSHQPQRGLEHLSIVEVL